MRGLTYNALAVTGKLVMPFTLAIFLLLKLVLLGFFDVLCAAFVVWGNNTLACKCLK